MLTFGADNRIMDGQDGREDTREYVPATASADADVPPVAVEGTREGDGVLKIGALLPQTGSLAFLGPPEFAGAELAIEDINAAGGVLGEPVEWLARRLGRHLHRHRHRRRSTVSSARTSTPSSVPPPRRCP